MGKRAVHYYWTAAETGYQLEGTARLSVQGLGHEVHFPQFRAAARGGVRRVLPLFERYILVRVDSHQNPGHIGRAKGVKRLLRGAGDENAGPARIPQEKIDWLRSLEGSDGYVVLEDQEPPAFAFREQVIALRGTFRDQRGEYRGIDMTNPRRARIAFTIFGREVMSSQPRYDLARAS